jgi:hypothetical protein
MIGAFSSLSDKKRMKETFSLVGKGLKLWLEWEIYLSSSLYPVY